MDKIEAIIFYSGGRPRKIDTKENLEKYAKAYPKWWDGIIFRFVPRADFENGLITEENLQLYI